MTQIETGSRLSLEEMRELNRRYVFFSWSIQNEVEAITIETGKGVYFWDANGKRYLDFSSQLMNLLILPTNHLNYLIEKLMISMEFLCFSN